MNLVRKKLLTTLLLALIAVGALSQNAIDSLKNALEKSSSDTSKIITMLSLAENYFYTDENKSREYFNNAKTLLDKVQFKNGTAYSYYVNGYLLKNTPAAALESFNKSLIIYTELKNNPGIAKANLAIGSTYINQSKLDKGMPYYSTALQIYQSLNDRKGIGVCYSALGNIYAHQGKFKMALDYNKKALKYLTYQSYAYFNEHVSIANNYSALGEAKMALLYYDSLLNTLKNKNYFDILSNVYANLGAIYSASQNYNKAKQCYKSSIEYGTKGKNDYYSIVACLTMSDLYINLNQPDSVINLLKKNSPTIIRYKSKTFLSYYYQFLSSAYEVKGDINSALKYYKSFKSAEDSLNIEQSNQRLYELQTSLDVEKKDKEIDLLNKENQYKSLQLSKQRIMILLILLSTVLFLVMAFVLYTRFRLKHKLVGMLENKNREIEQQQQEIMAMNDMLGKQNESLLELDDMKSRFFTNISHEFRTPLSLIIGPLTSMLEESNNKEAQNEFRLMLKHANSLLNLINQLLDLSKLQKASLNLQLSYYDINTFLNILIDSFSGRAKDLSIALTYNSNPLPLFVWFDRDKVGTIVFNIISNALKHTDKGGFVEVSLARIGEDDNYVEIMISDNGIGIESHELKNIFEPFYQSNATINRKIEGSGIGLALAKELVELHGGEISVKSEAGKGAQFTIVLAVNKHLLPFAEIMSDEDQKVDEIDRFPKLHEFDLGGEVEPKIIKGETTILVVEDNDDMRDYISKSLAQDYQIIVAVNGREGFDKAMEVSPDLIITDVMMPEMNGYEMTKLIKNNQQTSHIPVIILTAKASEESKIEGLEAAADDYLVKPFNKAELLLRIRNTISNRQKLRDKFQKSITVNPSEVTATSLDEQFLTKALQIIENHLADAEFSVNDFCDEIGMSKTNVYRKLKALTNQSFTEFMRCIRLKRAASLLVMKSGNLTEIAYETGFSNLSYFSRSFKEQFGVSPSEYTTKVKN
ncbi:MAG: response regulator [Bacteroidales bacterium]|nr:response regulator [Bacteroidales bacterium]